jgi:hypothetical protein
MFSGMSERPVRWRRAITVDAVDGAGGRAVGTELQFSVGDIPLCTVTMGAYPVRLEFEEPTTTMLQISAQFVGETATTHLPPHLNDYEFQFRTVWRGIYAGPGTARCPDGTAGQPCVDCNINGSIVRICA